MRILKFVIRSWLVVGLAALYVGWIFLTRWQENRELERRAAEAKRAEAQRTAEALGGNRFAILNFYASPPAIHRGEAVQLCYGVSNAKSVRIEPESGAIWPSYGRCVAVNPAKTTTYTLIAEDSSGNSKTATVTVQVR